MKRCITARLVIYGTGRLSVFQFQVRAHASKLIEESGKTLCQAAWHSAAHVRATWHDSAEWITTTWHDGVRLSSPALLIANV